LKTLSNIVIIYVLTLAGTMTLLMANAGFSQNLVTTAAATVLEVRNGTATLEGEDGGVRPARPRGVVYFGDLIRPSRGAIVVIQCDSKQREVRDTSGLGDICPDIVRLRRGTTSGPVEPPEQRGWGFFPRWRWGR